MRTVYEQKIGTAVDDGRLLLQSILGVGAFGVVYLASERHSSLQYAVKCLDKREIKPCSKREVSIHQLACSHPGVLTLYKSFDEGTYRYLVLEYCPDGDLFDMVTRTTTYAGNDQLVKHIFIQILDAVEHCHSTGIYHRDLKLENVLCQEGGRTMLLADFGLATDVKVSTEHACGSEQYMSPDCRGKLFPHIKSYSTIYNDVWALGIILANIVSGRGLWADPVASDPLFDAYCRKPDQCLRDWLALSRQANDLLCRVLNINWRERPSILEFREAVRSIDRFTLTPEELEAEREVERAARVLAELKWEEEKADAYERFECEEQPRPRSYDKSSGYRAVEPCNPLGLDIEDAHSPFDAFKSPSISPTPSLSPSEGSATDPSPPVTPEMAAVASIEDLAYLENITELSLGPPSPSSSFGMLAPSYSPKMTVQRFPKKSTVSLRGSSIRSPLMKASAASMASSGSSGLCRIFYPPNVPRKARPPRTHQSVKRNPEEHGPHKSGSWTWMKVAAP